jgi:malic enzyme
MSSRSADGKVTSLLTNATAVVTGTSFEVPKGRAKRTFQADLDGTGAISATVLVEGSNTGDKFLLLATISLSGTGSTSDGFASDAEWAYVRARVTAISGTGATVNVSMGS